MGNNNRSPRARGPAQGNPLKYRVREVYFWIALNSCNRLLYSLGTHVSMFQIDANIRVPDIFCGVRSRYLCEEPRVEQFISK